MCACDGPTLAVLYDGDCGVCSWLRDLLERLDRGHHLALVNAHTPGALARFEVTRAQADAELWARYPNGVRVGGAGAVLAAADAALQLRWGSRLYSLPRLRRVLDRAYAWFAANRHRFRVPGRASACSR